MSIVPVNSEMAKKVTAVGLLNDFVAFGFDRRSFVQVVIDIHPSFNNLQGVNRLNNFWALREFSINSELIEVLGQLKKE